MQLIRSLILCVALFGVSLLFIDSFNSANAELNSSVRIPEASITLGSTLDEIIQAAERCTIENDSACALEEYSDELSDGTTVTVPSFLIDQTEVSVGDYQRCVSLGTCRPARYDLTTNKFSMAHLPVVLVTQQDATNYCQYVGSRLPTEAEFEVAASGATSRNYPWGNQFHTNLANFGSRRAPYSDERDGYQLLAQVRAFVKGASPQGVLQLAGNVAEWTSTPYVRHGERHDAAPSASSRVVVKGGSFRTLPVDQRSRARRAMAPEHLAVDVGFRCARSAQPAPSVVKRAR